MNTCQSPFNSEILTAEQRDIDSWYYVDPKCLSEADFDFFMRCRKGVQMVLDGASNDAIRTEAGLSPRMLRRRLRKAFERALDSELVGQRAFLKRYRLRAYTRWAPLRSDPVRGGGGYAGVFRQLLREHPRVEQTIVLYYLRLKRKGVVHESHIRFKSVLKRFLDACRDAGLKPTDYPFNTRRLGYESLRRFCRTLDGRHFNDVAAGLGGDPAMKRAVATDSDGQLTAARGRKPYVRVELDVHTIDAIWTFEIINTPSGMPAQLVLDRIYVIVIVEVESRARLAYHLCLREKPGVDDILACIGKAVRPWVRRVLTIPGLAYHESGGFPSGCLAKFAWAVWQELHFDRDWCNLANDCRHAVMHHIGCQIIVGEGDTPNRRPFIERSFGQMESAGFHRLPNTTGSEPKDFRRQRPDEAARRFRMTYEQLEESFDVMLANENAAPTEGLEWRSPLEYLAHFDAMEGFVVGHIPPEEQPYFTINKKRCSVRVRGSVKTGQRPFIELDRGRYTSPVLKKLPGLIGKRIEVEADQDPRGDYRTVRAFLENGHDLGILTVKGPWARVRHSVADRKLVNRLRARGILHYAENQDPIQALLDALGEQITKSGKKGAPKGSIRRARNLYADLAGRERPGESDRVIDLDNHPPADSSIDPPPITPPSAPPTFSSDWEGLQ